MLIYLQWLLCWSSIFPMVALIEYNLGALCNPSPIGGVAGKVDCEVAPQLANAIVQLAGPARMA